MAVLSSSARHGGQTAPVAAATPATELTSVVLAQASPMLEPTPAADPTPSAWFVGSAPTPVAAAGSTNALAARSFVVLGDSLSAWAFAPGSTSHSTSGVWPSLLAARDPLLSLANNAGVPGNTTGQMLARLQRDVLDCDPDMLFVLGGTNDVGEDVPEATALDNIRTIVETARGQGITVVLLTMPPTNGQYADLRVIKKQLNVDLADLARSEGVLLVDIDAVLSTPDGSLAADYAAFDGLHLTQHGEQAVADAVYRALHPTDLPRR
jgi:lysophospholipase L1-like esterase